MNKQILAKLKPCFLIILFGASVFTGCKKNEETPVVTPPVKEGPGVPVVPSSNQYVTKLFDYLPAPGQFVNTDIANMTGAKSILGKTGIVSLGAWGGYIVLGFDHTVINQPDKDDIIVYGNALANFSEPGIVWVMNDENGNGLPDDTWYELAGSEFGKDGYVRNYEVTYSMPDTLVTRDIPWKDNKGKTGSVETVSFHKQLYYPKWLNTSQYTLKGSVLPAKNVDLSNPTYITSMPFAWGYADNLVDGNKVDIANAVDSNGQKVVLKGIDFIKVQTAVMANMGWLGELSTEVLGVADLSMVKEK